MSAQSVACQSPQTSHALPFRVEFANNAATTAITIHSGAGAFSGLSLSPRKLTLKVRRGNYDPLSVRTDDPWTPSASSSVYASGHRPSYDSGSVCPVDPDYAHIYVRGLGQSDPSQVRRVLKHRYGLKAQFIYNASFLGDDQNTAELLVPATYYEDVCKILQDNGARAAGLQICHPDLLNVAEYTDLLVGSTPERKEAAEPFEELQKWHAQRLQRIRVNARHHWVRMYCNAYARELGVWHTLKALGMMEGDGDDSASALSFHHLIG